LRAALTGRDINIGHSESQIIPIILGDNLRAKSAAADLQQEGFDVLAVRPPAVPPGTARLRVSVNAKLDEGILERFAASVQRVTSCSTVSS
jgi:8-amino-7-oxononanoate synthase